MADPRVILDIKRESNDLEVRRCTCLIQNNALERRLQELADDMLEGDAVAIAIEMAQAHDQMAENIQQASQYEKQLAALKWRLVEMEA